ncbi:MAG: hypothetical protein ABSG43_09260 [Solirubrobacteraceae bacterium]|jgi:hypothetical protein
MIHLSTAERLDTDKLVLELAEPDPVHQAAREVVHAVLDSCWTLDAAAVVVALRRLCDTVLDSDA